MVIVLLAVIAIVVVTGQSPVAKLSGRLSDFNFGQGYTYVGSDGGVFNYGT